MSDKNNIIDFQAGIKKLKDISNVSGQEKEATIETKKQEKLVPFPGAKLASIEQALDVDEKMKSILGGRVISTLLGMFVLTVVAQSLWFSGNSSQADRKIASTTQRSLAGVEAYLSASKRGVASIAKLPSQIENFNFGTLRGVYNIKTESQLITSFSSNGKFIKVGSMARFLKKHKKLWKPKFSSLKLSQASRQKKVYILLNSKRQLVGKAIISLDKQGNLQSLQFVEGF